MQKIELHNDIIIFCVDAKKHYLTRASLSIGVFSDSNGMRDTERTVDLKLDYTCCISVAGMRRSFSSTQFI